ncbi:hypothetical protein DFJ73DRAFT_817025 [Zopfochytrium polystomum]|nr:hypothetical protein DFJ73DRAFT_817025 [Zopfochytrium polystomum]
MKDCSERVAPWVASAGSMLMFTTEACILLGGLAIALLIYLRYMKAAKNPPPNRAGVVASKPKPLKPFDIFFMSYNTTYLPLVVALYLSTFWNTSSLLFISLVAVRHVGLTICLLYFISLVLSSTNRSVRQIEVIRNKWLPLLAIPAIIAAGLSSFAGYLHDMLFSANEALLAAAANNATAGAAPASQFNVSAATADFQYAFRLHSVVQPLAGAMAVAVLSGMCVFLSVAWLASRRELRLLESTLGFQDAGKFKSLFPAALASFTATLEAPTLPRRKFEILTSPTRGVFGKVSIDDGDSPMSYPSTPRSANFFSAASFDKPLPPLPGVADIPLESPLSPRMPPSSLTVGERTPTSPSTPSSSATASSPQRSYPYTSASQPLASPSTASPMSPKYPPQSPLGSADRLAARNQKTSSMLPFNPDNASAAAALRRNMRTLAWIFAASLLSAVAGLVSLVVSFAKNGGAGVFGTAEVMGFVVENGGSLLAGLVLNALFLVRQSIQLARKLMRRQRRLAYIGV